MDSLVTRLHGLPALLLLLLCFTGAVVSSSAAWVQWLGQESSNRDLLERILPAGEKLGVRTAPAWFRLAELDPDREQRWLEESVRCDPRYLPARFRLSLAAEFSSQRDAARAHIEAATHFHRSHQAFLAALAQAVRWGERERVVPLARQALRYCPRDADGIYLQLDRDEAALVVAAAGPHRQRDYLRFLLGQNRLADAVWYEAQVGADAEWEALRLEICERLWLSGERASAAMLFGRLRPEFARAGIYNARFEQEPTSLGFDWRLSQQKGVRIGWRPGELEIQLEELAAAAELISIFVQEKEGRPARLTPIWTGDTEQLRWEARQAGERWKRYALLAPAGKARRIQIREVRFE